MNTFRGESSEKTWIMRIAINTCYNINHSGWFRFLNRRVTPEMMPNRAVQTNEDDEELATAVTKLPLKLREVILLYYYEEMTLKEISNVMDVSESRVSQLHSKALVKMKQRLGSNMQMFLG